MWCCVSLQILLAGPSGEKGRIPLRNPKRVRSITLWPCTGRPLPHLLLMRQRIRAQRRWTAFPANAHRTTEVPPIGLTLRSTPLPHSSLSSALVRCCTNPVPTPLPPPTTSKETPHILPKMLSRMFTFPRGQVDVLHCGKTVEMDQGLKWPLPQPPSKITPSSLQNPPFTFILWNLHVLRFERKLWMYASKSHVGRCREWTLQCGGPPTCPHPPPSAAGGAENLLQCASRWQLGHIISGTVSWRSSWQH